MSMSKYIPTNEPSRTKQAPANDANINTIVSRFLKTGVLPNRYPAWQSGDLVALPDLQGMLDAQLQARAAYDKLPAQIREETQGDPARLSAWLLDPRNIETAIKLGVLVAKTPPLGAAPEGGKGGEAPPDKKTDLKAS